MKVAQKHDRKSVEKHTGKPATHATPTERRDDSLQTEISERAYQLWLKRGCVHGFDQEDWLRAENELLQESAI
jgi:hypothetical protein